MNDWIRIEDESMPLDNLCLVYQELTGICLRNQYQEGEFYDENNNFDDSELEITHWMLAPERPND